MTDAARTPLYDWHVAHGGRMVDFAGWDMPVQYTGIVAEHNAVRTAAGLFDVSHMGRLFVTGPDASKAIAKVATCPIQSMTDGRVRYGLVLAEDGGAIDDILVTRFAEDRWLVVANASGRDAVLPLLKQAAADCDAAVVDRTTELAMLAVQGPQAVEIVDSFFPGDFKPSSLKYYWADSSELYYTAEGDSGPEAIVSRTGYTGEDGFELIVPAEVAVNIADRLIDAGVSPAGLGARDTLRLEAGMPLYGHELTRDIDPITAGLTFAVRKSGGFTGAEALAAKSPATARVGLIFDGKRPVREGAPLFVGDTQVGSVTSGTMSPTLAQPIAMGYVERKHSDVGESVAAEVRGTRISGTVVELPFYRRDR